MPPKPRGETFQKGVINKVKSVTGDVAGKECFGLDNLSRQHWSRLDEVQQSGENERHTAEQKRNNVVPRDRCQGKIYVVLMRGETTLAVGAGDQESAREKGEVNHITG